jgi:hypothetical protein
MRRWLAVVVFLLVINGGCVSDEVSGVEELRMLRSEAIWDELPPGGTRELFASPERCEPYGDETSIWLRVSVNHGGIAAATRHYIGLLEDGGWDISKEAVTDDQSSVSAEKATETGLQAIEITGYSANGDKRVEVRGWPGNAC